MDKKLMAATAAGMVATGKGLLAADESSATVAKRFAGVNVENTEPNRRTYRDMLFTTPDIGKYISGVILFDETIKQQSLGGVAFPKLLEDQGIIPGIKVDGGAKDLPAHPGELVTEGLDNLRGRLADYFKLGARFAKWRAVITIGKDMPSWGCVEANAHALARYSALCQEANIVPIIEPEVLIDGDHTIERCFEVTEATLRATFQACYSQRVSAEHMILKASMVISGKGCPVQASEAVADELDAQGATALAAHLFLFARVARGRTEGLERQAGELEGGAAGVRAPCTHVQPRIAGQVQRGGREEGRLSLARLPPEGRSIERPFRFMDPPAGPRMSPGARRSPN
jgi:fructose-bisphosphate aldolase, class I